MIYPRCIKIYHFHCARHGKRKSESSIGSITKQNCRLRSTDAQNTSTYKYIPIYRTAHISIYELVAFKLKSHINTGKPKEAHKCFAVMEDKKYIYKQICNEMMGNQINEQQKSLTVCASSNCVNGRLGRYVWFWRFAHSQKRWNCTGMPNSFATSSWG